MTRVHAREEKQILDHTGQTMSLVQQRGQLLVDFRFKIITGEQSFQTRAQDRDRAFQLMGSISRVSCRSLQFLPRRNERDVGASSFRAILLRIQRQLLYWYGEPERHEVAGHKSAQQKQDTRTANLPAKPMQLRHRIGK